ncbi:MAG: hypothetical protein JO041_02855 [Acidobacteria bacterium]|nr:hypothetical protein [Acidobacteriota bacterium]
MARYSNVQVQIRFSLRIFALALLLAAASSAQQNPPRPVLPEEFAGWKQTSSTLTATAAQADPLNAALLKEFGFTGGQRASYARQGRTLQVQAMRFDDAGGAYGAYTAYVAADAVREDVGDEAASLSHAKLFRQGNLLVAAQFDQVTAMSAAELRELASELPKVSGPKASLPSLPLYLPRDSLVANSVHYAAGPEAFARLASPVGAATVQFERGAEVVAARYRAGDTNAALLLISYPTPQIAAERARAIASAVSSQPDAVVRRSGPIVALAIDSSSPREARSLASAVHYDANVTWNEPTFLGPRNNVGNLVIACLMLAAILILLALVAGFAFGGFRILMKKLFPDRVFDRARDLEIIRLKLWD